MTKHVHIISMMAVLGLVLGVTCATEAASIGINFGTTTTSTQLNAATSAGFTDIAQTNWNNGTSSKGTISSVVDSTGATVSGTTIVWNNTSSDRWTSTGRTGGFTGGDVNLYSAYLASGWAGDAFVTITNIPYAQYDVYVYLTGNDTYNRAGAASLSNTGGETGGLDTDKYWFRVTNSGGYQQSTQTTTPADIYNAGNYMYANYAVFSGNSADGFTVTASDNMGTWNVDIGIAGIQIVDTTPEPATMCVLLCGGVGVLLKKSRRKAIIR